MTHTMTTTSPLTQEVPTSPENLLDEEEKSINGSINHSVTL